MIHSHACTTPASPKRARRAVLRARFGLAGLLALSGLLLASSAARADRHYLLIFGSQTQPKIPRYTHTFCTIVRVADPLPGCANLPLEVHTISWLPATLKVRPFRLHAEPGHNFTLEETLN